MTRLEQYDISGITILNIEDVLLFLTITNAKIRLFLIKKNTTSTIYFGWPIQEEKLRLKNKITQSENCYEIQS